MFGKTKDTTKYAFRNFLKSVGANSVKFEYVRNCNDEFNPCGTPKKQATYEFYAIAGGVRKLLVMKQHRRSHDVVEEELLRKFLGWAKGALVNEHRIYH